jgi:hypothetical protein
VRELRASFRASFGMSARLLTQVFRLALILASAFTALGCTSTEGQCERLCEWEQRCSSDAVSVDDCAQTCVKDTESETSDCQDAFDDFASCTADNQSCPGVDNQCVNQANRYVRRCNCGDAHGALAELCRE